MILKENQISAGDGQELVSMFRKKRVINSYDKGLLDSYLLDNRDKVIERDETAILLEVNPINHYFSVYDVSFMSFEEAKDLAFDWDIERAEKEYEFEKTR